MPGRCVVVGSVNTDVVVSVPRFAVAGETIAARDARIVGGGKGANQAVGVARWGVPVALVAALGDDPFSEGRWAELVADQVDVGAVRRVPGLGGLALIEIDGLGENRIVVVSGANGALDVGWVREQFEVLRVGRGDVVCVQLEIPLEAASAALELGREAGAWCLLNATPWTNEAEHLIANCDVLVVNRLEAYQVAGLVGSDPLDPVAEALASRVSTVFITLGAQGAICVAQGARWRCAAPRVVVVDTTAAGDAFVAAVAAGLLEGLEWPAVLQRAVWAGSLAVQRFGARPSLPTKWEVERALAERPLLVDRW